MYHCLTNVGVFRWCEALCVIVDGGHSDAECEVVRDFLDRGLSDGMFYGRLANVYGFGCTGIWS